MNQAFLEEARELERRWAERPPVRDRNNEVITRVLLENQRLLNEQPNNPNVAQFRRISIPLIRQIYPQLIGPMFPLNNPKPEAPQKVNWSREGF